jgi:hypothetical protein
LEYFLVSDNLFNSSRFFDTILCHALYDFRLEAVKREKCDVEEKFKNIEKQSINEKAALEKQIKRYKN